MGHTSPPRFAATAGLELASKDHSWEAQPLDPWVLVVWHLLRPQSCLGDADVNQSRHLEIRTGYGTFLPPPTAKRPPRDVQIPSHDAGSCRPRYLEPTQRRAAWMSNHSPRPPASSSRSSARRFSKTASVSSHVIHRPGNSRASGPELPTANRLPFVRVLR